MLPAHDCKNRIADIHSCIQRLKKEREAIILAHNYQNDEIQEIADFVGDSLALSQTAAVSTAKVVIICGVHFMAETAAILAPGKKVILPVTDAGCPMADMADTVELARWRAVHPSAAVVSYVNTPADIKAVSDYCCTSANAVTLVQNIPEKEIIFLPDQNLGSYVADRVPEKKIHLWPGYCPTHHQITAEATLNIKKKCPDALLLVHPECRPEVTRLADFVGSTSQICRYVKSSSHSKFIIGTEMGVLYSMKAENPDKIFYLLSPAMICLNMKKIRLEDVLKSLTGLAPIIDVAPNIRAGAVSALTKMLEYV